MKSEISIRPVLERQVQLDDGHGTLMTLVDWSSGVGFDVVITDTGWRAFSLTRDEAHGLVRLLHAAGVSEGDEG